MNSPLHHYKRLRICSTTTKSRRKESIEKLTSDIYFELLFPISKRLEKMRENSSSRNICTTAQRNTQTLRFMTFQVIVSVLVLVQCFPLTQSSPSPAPVVTVPTDSGVYSIFPNEDLKTGRKSFRDEEIRPLRDRDFKLLSHNQPYRGEIDRYRNRDINRFRDIDRYRDRDGRNTGFRDDSAIGLRRISNYRISRPIEKYNQILFDDERLNYPSVRIPDRDRGRDYRYPDRDSGSYFNSYRDRNLPYYRQRSRGNAVLLPITSPRHLSGFRPVPPLPEPKYPPRPYNSAEGPGKARIHVFDPASKTFKQGLPPTISKLPNVKPGRLLIPGYNSGSQEEPGPNLFLNHEEYLDFHTKKALMVLDNQEKKKAAEKEDAGESDKLSKAKHVLFSPNIGGLRPPLPNSNGESTEDGDDDSSEGDTKKGDRKPEAKFQKVKGVTVKPLSELTINKDQNKSSSQVEEASKNGQVLRLKGVSTLRSSSQDAQSKGVKSQLGTEVVAQQQKKTIQGVDSQQRLNSNGQILNQIPSVTQTSINPNSNAFFSLVDHNPFGPTVQTTFAPNAFSGFDGHQQNPLLGPIFRVETESPPLIFLESQDKRKVESFDGKGNSNMILVQRVRTPSLASELGIKNSNGTKLSEVKSTGVKNSGQEKDVETTMKVHKSQADSFEAFKEFNLQAESVSNTGIVSKVHAHISSCPKLHQMAEVICDVHIRKRHGSSNPQLVVGWKRKFHNATQPDIVLALNKTLAYEEDFHDKFNVTLAPGISPTLRSVLLIRHVAPPDTGNYQCEVNDGENHLKSDTLLFLCH